MLEVFVLWVIVVVQSIVIYKLATQKIKPEEKQE